MPPRARTIGHGGGHDGGPDGARDEGEAVSRRRGVPGGAVPGRLGRRAAVLALAVVLSGCALVGGPRTVVENVPDIMTVTSPAVTRGILGRAYTCRGGGKSPAIRWSGAPPGTRTKSLALVVDDAAAPVTPYIYWIVFNIGPQTTDIPDGQIPPGAEQADNSKGKAAYDPPCPANPGHGYRFTVYALRAKLKLRDGVSAKTAWLAIAAAAIARGRLPVTASP